MFERSTITGLTDFARPLAERTPPGVYFVRVYTWSQAIRDGIWRFHELARQRGVIIEERIGNPDGRQISYMTDALGTAFEPTAAFAEAALKKWMPRMSDENRRAFAEALHAQYRELARLGKPEGVMKNVYIKMMCWLYYRFERLMPLLGGPEPPKVLYEGSAITNHELIFLRMLSMMGVDILLVEARGDAAYLKQDPKSQWSQPLPNAGGAPFPQDFSIKALRGEMAAAMPPRTAVPVNRPAQPATQIPRVPPRPGQSMAQPPRPGQPVNQTGRLVVQATRPVVPANRRAQPAPARIVPESYFKPPAHDMCTNAWMKEADYQQILTPAVTRGDDPKLFYNAYIRLYGVRDRLTYVNELYRFYQHLTSIGRTVLALDGPLPVPDPEELSRVRRRNNYRAPEELIVDLAGNLPASARPELQRLMQRAFIDVLKDAARAETNLNRLVVTAVYLLCFIQRYQGRLFQGWKEGAVPAFILMGGCRDQNDALYVRWLSRLPVDVLLLAPNLDQPCAVEDAALLELRGEESLPVMKFPRDDAALQMRTMAAHAERDLDSLLYSDSGMYRSRQFAHANAITLHTTYDELFILWNQELKYRQNFSTAADAVNMPVLFAKVSGVEKGKMLPYWQKLKLLVGDDTLFVKQLPMIPPASGNAYQALAVKCLKNGRLRRDALKADRQYPFGLIREELQAHIFDKLQLMLDRRLIKGTFENGTEYTVVATVLNMRKELVRMLQGFDFTRRNPKVVCVSTRERGATLEDAIMLTFLNLAGFDVALFVPTGYQTIERFMAGSYPVEHQIGEYVYDQSVPDLAALPSIKGHSWLNKLLRRDN